MGRRLFDIVVSFIALVVVAPLLGIVAVGVRLASPGPSLYRARRVGRNGKLFTMYKLRTMHTQSGAFASTITATNDPRVFPFGALLRRYKIDELPQLFNILTGDMSFVGPRPEDPSIIQHHYDSAHLETLEVVPGLVSPGSIYNYTHGEHFLDGEDPEAAYVQHLLSIKLALDTVYVWEASFAYNLRLMCRALWVIGCMVVGRRHFPDPPEMERAQRLMQPAKSA